MTAEKDLQHEADVLIEVGHPSRPDRAELMREHIARIKARTLREAADDLDFVISRGAVIATRPTCHKKACRCAYSQDDGQLVGLLVDGFRDALRALADATEGTA